MIKTNKAITLIALIITIIILVILAAVSIRAVYNMGIVNYAVNGTQDYAKASKEEEKTMQDTENFLEEAIEKIKNAQNGDGDGDKIDTEDEPVTVPDILRTYVLGTNEEGKKISKILNETTFKDETSTIADASTSIIYLNTLYGDYKQGETQERRIYIRYNNVGYKILVSNDTSSSVQTTTGIEVAYVPHGREGEIVQYSVDGTSAAINWLVIYDNGSTLDITPVSIDNSWKYSIGYINGSGDSNATGGTDIAKAMNSYEYSVERLNTYCGTIITNTAKQGVRSIGTQFNITDTTARYSSTFLANNPSGSAGTYNGVGKVGDFNAEQDVIRMSYFSEGGTESGYTTYGYARTGSLYWLTSRYVIENSNSVGFHTRYVNDSGIVTANCTWLVDNSDVSRGSWRTGVRPVVRVFSSQV